METAPGKVVFIGPMVKVEKLRSVEVKAFIHLRHILNPQCPQ